MKIILQIIGALVIFFALLMLIVAIDDGELDWAGAIFIFIVAVIGGSLFKVGSNKTDIEKVLLENSSKKNEKLSTKIATLEEAINNFDKSYSGKKSPNVFVGENINNDCLAIHKKKYLNLASKEHSLQV